MNWIAASANILLVASSGLFLAQCDAGTVPGCLEDSDCTEQAGQYCEPSVHKCMPRTCTPDCASRECGPDPQDCGTTCGTCNLPDQHCDMTTGRCQSCNPDCGARVCGPVPNGCGESCGACQESESCDTTNGRCQPNTEPVTCTKTVAQDGSGDFTTIQAAADAARPGDTVCVKAGTYFEKVCMPNSGSAGNWITLTNYPGQKPVLDGTGVPQKSCGGSVGATIGIFDKQYIKISGFRIQNNPSASVTEYNMNYGIYVSGTSETSASRHIIIEKNDLYKTGGSGIFLQYGQYVKSYTPGDEDFVVQDNVLELVNYAVVDGVSMQEGLETNRVHNFVIRNNTVNKSNKEAIAIGLSKYGRIYNNTVSGGSITYSGLGANGAGIYIACNRGPCVNADIEAYNNRISGRMNAIVVATEDGWEVSGVKIYNNIGYENTINFRLVSYASTGKKRDIFFVNNVAYGATSGSGFDVSTQPLTNVVFRNNIAIGNSGSQMAGMTRPGVTADHNLITGDPFVDAAGGDFHLKSTATTAIDMGSSVLAPLFDFDNHVRPVNLVDIGAYEFGAASPGS